MKIKIKKQIKIVVDTSESPKNALVSLKTTVDKLDFDELNNVPNSLKQFEKSKVDK